MTEIKLTQKEIDEMKKAGEQLIGGYGTRNSMFERYEEIYFMNNPSKPKNGGVDDKDWKITTSSSGRDAVIGMKRILDTAEIQIKVCDYEGQPVGDSDKIERALKGILKTSGEYRQARIEKDTNLSAALYGPATLSVESVDDILTTIKDKFVRKQLAEIQKRSPFVIRAINAKESYPEWGDYGMVGHLHKYTVKGSVLRERWGAAGLTDNQNYTVKDYFHYEKRVVWADNTLLFAGEWMDEKTGLTNIPIFSRYAGGTSIFHEMEKQIQPLLYAKAMGEWDLRENLFWTNIFTAIFRQGLPGPTLVRDPEDITRDMDGNASAIDISYEKGLRIITAKGKLESPSVIDRDVMGLKTYMDEQAALQTIQPQTLGQNTQGITFSQFAMASRTGLIPAQDPKEATEQVYKDAFSHILQRVKNEGMKHPLFEGVEIPDNFDLIVTLEPNLAQDDLRNATIAAQLKGATNISDEWVNTNLLKIADSRAMFKQKITEDFKKAIVAGMLSNPQFMQQAISAIMGQGQQQPQQDPNAQQPEGQPSPEQMAQAQGMSAEQDAQAMGMAGQPGMEAVGMTEGAPLPQERVNGQRPTGL